MAAAAVVPEAVRRWRICSALVRKNDLSPGVPGVFMNDIERLWDNTNVVGGGASGWVVSFMGSVCTG